MILTRIVLFGISNGGGFAPLVANGFPAAAYVTVGAWSKTWFEHMTDLERRRVVLEGTEPGRVDAAMKRLAEFHAAYLFDRLTPAEKRYLRAMAELGPGPHRSGDIAHELGRQVTSLGPTRNQLISKGMIWSPNHGDTAFTVPLFDEFMKRIMPDEVF